MAAVAVAGAVLGAVADSAGLEGRLDRAARDWAAATGEEEGACPEDRRDSAAE